MKPLLLALALCFAGLLTFAPPTVRAGTPTTVNVASSPNPSVFGHVVTIVAAVSPTPLAGDSVVFLDNGSSAGIGATDAFGTATLSLSALTIGGHTFTALFLGDASFDAGTGTGPIHLINA